MVPDFTSAAEPRAYAIYEHYGFAHQVLKLAEEASELAAACARVGRSPSAGTSPGKSSPRSARSALPGETLPRAAYTTTSIPRRPSDDARRVQPCCEGQGGDMSLYTKFLIWCVVTVAAMALLLLWSAGGFQ